MVELNDSMLCIRKHYSGVIYISIDVNFIESVTDMVAQIKKEDRATFNFLFEGARVGWILVADHPSVRANTATAIQRGLSHTALGEGHSHSSRPVHIDTGTSHSCRNCF